MKKNTLIIFIVGILACFFFWFLTSNNNSKIKLIELKNIEPLYSDNNNMYVYFGRPSCETCRKFEKQIENNNSQLPKIIYYFDTDAWRQHGITDAVCKKYGIKTVPSLIKIKDGKCIEIIDISLYIN